MASCRPILGQIESGGRVLFIRLRSMGDCVLTTPALKMLSEFRPDLEIGVMVDAPFRGIYEGLRSVSRILQPSLGEAFSFAPTLCVNLHGGPRSAWLTAASRARFRAGFQHYRKQFVYNVQIPRAQEVLGEERPVHTAEHVASALFYLGLPAAEIPRAELSASMPQERQYAVLHPFASSAEKTWPAANFAAIAAHIERHHLQPVILAGPSDDVAPFAKYRCLVNQPLADVKQLIRGASLFLGNDSGPAHIAAAFDVPLAVLFGPSNPSTWSPWRATKSQVVTCQGPIASITVDDVKQAVARLLEVCPA